MKTLACRIPPKIPACPGPRGANCHFWHLGLILASFERHTNQYEVFRDRCSRLEPDVGLDSNNGTLPRLHWPAYVARINGGIAMSEKMASREAIMASIKAINPLRTRVNFARKLHCRWFSWCQVAPWCRNLPHKTQTPQKNARVAACMHAQDAGALCSLGIARAPK